MPKLPILKAKELAKVLNKMGFLGTTKSAATLNSNILTEEEPQFLFILAKT